MVTVDDLGDRLIVEPAAEDPIEATEGALSDYFDGVSIAGLRDARRREEEELETRRDERPE